MGDTPDTIVKVYPPGSCLWLGNLDKVGNEEEMEKEKGKEKGEVPWCHPVRALCSSCPDFPSYALWSHGCDGHCGLLNLRTSPHASRKSCRFLNNVGTVNVDGSPPPQGSAQHGLHRDCTVVMSSRLKGGAPTIPGEWFCQVCQRGGCWPARTHCFRCGCKKGEKTLRGPPRERQALGRAPPSQGSAACPTERRLAPQQGSRKPHNAKLTQQVVLEALRSMGLPLELHAAASKTPWLLLHPRRSQRNGCWIFKSSLTRNNRRRIDWDPLSLRSRKSLCRQKSAMIPKRLRFSKSWLQLIKSSLKWTCLLLAPVEGAGGGNVMATPAIEEMDDDAFLGLNHQQFPDMDGVSDGGDPPGSSKRPRQCLEPTGTSRVKLPALMMLFRQLQSFDASQIQQLMQVAQMQFETKSAASQPCG